MVHPWKILELETNILPETNETSYFPTKKGIRAKSRMRLHQIMKNHFSVEKGPVPRKHVGVTTRPEVPRLGHCCKRKRERFLFLQ
jgi:hypothetical protein